MSNRALRRLRRPEDLLLAQASNDESDDNDDGGDSSDDDDDDDENYSPSTVPTTPAVASRFAQMMMIDDDDDEGSRSTNTSDGKRQMSTHVVAEKKVITKDGEEKEEEEDDDDDDDENEEDLDAILQDFKETMKNEDDASNDDAKSINTRSSSFFASLMDGVDRRDFDIDYASKSLLMGSRGVDGIQGGGGFGGGSSARQRGNSRKKAYLFGPPRDGWPRPPNFVGGGMGMTTYSDISKNDRQQEQQSHPALPWPYSVMNENDGRRPRVDQCYKFIYSTDYRRDLLDLETIVRSGDANALCMFVAHHPFIVQALFQLTTVLYQTNQKRHGMTTLKRALWVFDNAALKSFVGIDGNAFMDYDVEENTPFFKTLLFLVRISYIAGFSRTSLALSRWILSLDPLRDPLNMLVCMDHFALAMNTDRGNDFVTSFVESKKVQITYRDEDNTDDGFNCDVLDCPNWAYSYALALFRSMDRRDQADVALRSAVTKFPVVVLLLLAKNDIDTTSRSMQVDWPSVLPFLKDSATAFQNHALTGSISSDPLVRSCTIQSFETVVNIFVQMNYNLWKDDNVLKWLYNGVDALKSKAAADQTTSPSSACFSFALSPALMRFAQCDPSDFDNKITTMPAEANPLMPDTVEYAMIVDVRRPRLVQRAQHGGGRGGALGHNIEGEGLQAALGGAILLGPPVNDIDLDDPLVAIYLQGLLPWNRVP